MYKGDKVDIGSIQESLPQPKGYKLLVAAAKVEDKKGNVLLPEQYTQLEDTASILGVVIAIGPDAYKDQKRFPSGSYCKEGDWIMYRSYSGTRFKIGEQEFRMLNDDQVEATVNDPRAIERV